MRSSARARPAAGTFEYSMWLYTRLSGLAMILFAAISMGTSFALGGRTLLDLPTIFRWTFFPNPNHVVNSDIADVSIGWSNAFWQIYSTVFIFLAASHGINGLRMVIEDYVKRPLLVYTLRGLMFLILGGGLLVAVYVILAS
jgi:succinate dehydrogenase / fumarate reductase, membrane anchor subunit